LSYYKNFTFIFIFELTYFSTEISNSGIVFGSAENVNFPVCLGRTSLELIILRHADFFDVTIGSPKILRTAETSPSSSDIGLLTIKIIYASIKK